MEEYYEIPCQPKEIIAKNLRLYFTELLYQDRIRMNEFYIVTHSYSDQPFLCTLVVHLRSRWRGNLLSTTIDGILSSK